MFDAALVMLAVQQASVLDMDRVIQIGTFGLLIAGQFLTWRAMGRGEGRRAVKHSAEEATAVAKQVAAMETLAAANERVADALEGLQKWAREHERADDKFQSAAAEVQKQTADTLQRLAEMLANMQRQITNVALGIAPQSEVEVLPPNRRGARR